MGSALMCFMSQTNHCNSVMDIYIKFEFNNIPIFITKRF